MPKIKHTANPTHTAKLPLCRVPAQVTHGKNQTHVILPSLLCAVLKTHGKPRARDTHVRTGERRWTGAQLCRVPSSKHTANLVHVPLTCGGGERRWTEGRRRLTALNFAVCHMGHTANRPLRRVLHLGTRQTGHFTVCYNLAHGKQDTSPCAFSWHMANSLKILNFQSRNFFYTAETFLGTLY